MTPITSGEKTIFLEAIELSVAHRTNYLDQACGSNRKLRRQIEQLLAAHARSDLPLDQPAVTSVEALAEWHPQEELGSQIGPYKLREQIGEGGMGLVFVAEQTAPVRRQVALKVCKPGMDTREVMSRFEAERQALALMDHPNIAKVFDAGTTDSGRPYFVMELVRGIPITDYCEQAKLGTRERLKLFITVCQAVQHAHLKGIIHRDIKPTNVMVTLHDGVPVPKVIDFGVAKAVGQRLTEQTVYTQYAQLIGTPLYMSPEQAEFSGLDIDTRTDVYSLGVLLYELLTGTTPFERQTLAEKGLDEFRRLLRETDPPRPSHRISTLDAARQSTLALHRGLDPRQLTRSLQGELDWIVMKALEKDRNRRYETASDFAADVERYRHDEAVLACPPSALYRLRKLARRNKAAFAFTCLVVGFLLVSTVALSVANVLISRERVEVVQQRNIARQKEAAALASEQTVREREAVIREYLYAADMQLADQAYQKGDIAQVRERLERRRPAADLPDERGFEWHYLWGLCQGESRVWHGHSRDVFRVAYSSDGRLLASASRDRSVIVWNVADGTPRATLRQFTDDINAIAFSADGTLLATAEEKPLARVWDWQTGREVARFTEFAHPVAEVFFTPDQRYLVTSELRWDFSNPQAFRTTVWDLATRKLHASVDGYRALAVHPETQLLAGCNAAGGLGLWSLPDLEPRGTWAGRPSRTYCGTFTADGQCLAIGGDWGEGIQLWRIDDRSVVGFPSQSQHGARSLAFTPDGRRLVSNYDDGTTRVWDVPNRTTLKVLPRTHGRLWGTAVSPDGNTFAIGCEHGTVVLRDFVAMTQESRKIISWPAISPFHAVAVNATASRLAVADWSPTVRIFDALTGAQLATITLPDNQSVESVAFAPDGRSVWIGDGFGTVRQIDVATNQCLSTHQLDINFVNRLFVSPEGRYVASLALGRAFKVCEATTGRTLIERFSPKPENVVAPVGFLDEQSAITVQPIEHGCSVDVWDIPTGRIRQRFHHYSVVLTVAVS
ncbi:MAG: protein kinase, partial [Planctomycetaceae bacterium]